MMKSKNEIGKMIIDYKYEIKTIREVLNMKLIISPAKKMDVTDVLSWQELPVFVARSEVLLTYLKGLSYTEAKALWKCNDQIAELNMDRLSVMKLKGNLSPAILSYDGIQYKYMAPGVFEEASLEWIQEHLRILSGFYGILKPMDGITPYRLEMQAKVNIPVDYNYMSADCQDNSQEDGTSKDSNPMAGSLSDSILVDESTLGSCKAKPSGKPCKSLYDFWGRSLYDELSRDDHVILNLASKEYSKCIEGYLTEEDRFITCVFAEEVKGKLVQKGTLAKMARGEMVRFLAERKAERPEEAKTFDRLGFAFCEKVSSDREYVFTKKDSCE